MSEEEIINEIKEKVDTIKNLCTDDCINKDLVIKPLEQAIEGLLDLYNKEKEKNEKYKKSNKLYYIHKDKIREIIERLRKQHKNIFDAQMLYKELLGEKINY